MEDNNFDRTNFMLASAALMIPEELILDEVIDCLLEYKKEGYKKGEEPLLQITMLINKWNQKINDNLDVSEIFFHGNEKLKEDVREKFKTLRHKYKNSPLEKEEESQKEKEDNDSSSSSLSDKQEVQDLNKNNDNDDSEDKIKIKVIPMGKPGIA